MGRNIRAAKASLVAAFLAAGGATAAKALPAHEASPAAAAGGTVADGIAWGDPLIRFLKLEGFPAYLKIDGFAQLAQYYKPQLMGDGSTLYLKYEDQVANLLALYHKANAGPLAGILIGLERYYKDGDKETLLDFLKTPSNMDAYIKFTDFFDALQTVGRDEEDGGAFGFFAKETGIPELPAVQAPSGA
jgi:hypothetical protein